VKQANKWNKLIERGTSFIAYVLNTNLAASGFGSILDTLVITETQKPCGGLEES
jgi:hypothetical protein